MIGHGLLTRELAAVGPFAVTAYLRSRHWNQVEVLDDRASVWKLADHELVVPLRRDFADYALRVSEVLATLELVEGRSRLEILEGIRGASADVFRLRLEGPDLVDGTAPLASAGGVLDRARDLLLAAACSAITPRPLHGTRRPNDASEWAGRLRLAPPEAGSFIIKVISPVPPALDSQASVFLADQPLERRATATLMQAIDAARFAAAEAAGRGDVQPFEAAVQRGVSFNLCDALSGLLQASRASALDARMSWASTRMPPPGIPDHVVLGADAGPILRSAADALRARAPAEDFELVGYVPKMEREPADAAAPGTITILGLIEGAGRRVRVQLAPEDYRRAAEAHVGGRTVRVRGTLRKAGRAFVLENPRGFEVEPEEPGEA